MERSMAEVVLGFFQNAADSLLFGDVVVSVHERDVLPVLARWRSVSARARSASSA